MALSNKYSSKSLAQQDLLVALTGTGSPTITQATSIEELENEVAYWFAVKLRNGTLGSGGGGGGSSVTVSQNLSNPSALTGVAASSNVQFATIAGGAVYMLPGGVDPTVQTNWILLTGNSTPAASAVNVTPVGAITATNVQAALAALDTRATTNANNIATNSAAVTSASTAASAAQTAAASALSIATALQAGTVASFNTRTGAVVPATGDYTSSQVSRTATTGLSATNVEGALTALYSIASTASTNATAAQTAATSASSAASSAVHSVNGQTPTAGAVTVTATNVGITAISGVTGSNVQAALANIYSQTATAQTAATAATTTANNAISIANAATAAAAQILTKWITLVSGQVRILASGTLTDLATITATLSTSVAATSTVTIAYTGTTVAIQTVCTKFLAANTSGRTICQVVLPEPTGATTTDLSSFPILYRISAAGGIGATGGSAPVIASGNISSTISGYTAGTDQQLVVKM